MTELKPCPFCGSKAAERPGFNGSHDVRCSSIHCIAWSDRMRFASREDAIAAWNRRSPEGEAVNLPFERLPVCSCDPGHGDAPTRQDMLECKARGGPCSELYWRDPENCQPEQTEQNPATERDRLARAEALLARIKEFVRDRSCIKWREVGDEPCGDCHWCRQTALVSDIDAFLAETEKGGGDG